MTVSVLGYRASFLCAVFIIESLSLPDSFPELDSCVQNDVLQSSL